MSSKKYQPIFYVILIMLLAALFVACSPGAIQPGAAQVETNQGGITVVGRGEAYGKPDEAQLELGVETFAETVAEATSQNETNIQAIFDALQALGIAPEDIQTSNYSLWAEQRYGENGPEGITGYRVSNIVRVKIHDIERVGDVMAAVTEAGANNIHGVSFSVADPAALEAEAREAAIANAREKAASLAGLSDLELGDVIMISEVINQPGVIMDGMGGGRAVEEAAAPSIAPGELSYTVNIQVTFAIR